MASDPFDVDELFGATSSAAAAAPKKAKSAAKSAVSERLFSEEEEAGLIGATTGGFVDVGRRAAAAAAAAEDSSSGGRKKKRRDSQDDEAKRPDKGDFNDSSFRFPSSAGGAAGGKAGAPELLDEVRLGVLGASSIAPTAILRPARRLNGVSVVAVAAREVERATRFAAKWEIPTVHETYEALLEDDEVDAVYIGLPNALHFVWATRALEAGKHVLCEKPLASNREEATQLARVAAKTGRLIMAGYHCLYHPMAKRIKSILEDEVGAIESAEVSLCFPIFRGSDIRYSYELGGGAMMDAGCYCIAMLRYLLDEELVCTDASAKLASSAYRFIDQDTRAVFQTQSGVVAQLSCSIFTIIPKVSLRVAGKNGASVSATNWLAPHMLYNKLTVVDEFGSTRTEQFSRDIATYRYQLAAFVDALRSGDHSSVLTDGRWSVSNMTVTDEVYKKLDLPVRGLPDEELPDYEERQAALAAAAEKERLREEAAAAAAENQSGYGDGGDDDGGGGGEEAANGGGKSYEWNPDDGDL